MLIESVVINKIRWKFNKVEKADCNHWQSEILIDSIREKTSASNAPICDKCMLDFDKYSGQQTVFELFESATDLFLLAKIALGKHVILAISTLSANKRYSPLIKRSQKKISMPEGENRAINWVPGKYKINL